eukprot:1177341-Prorocentrum_minimum.AAC.4
MSLWGEFTRLGGEFTSLWGEFTSLWGEFTSLWGEFMSLGGEFTSLGAFPQRRPARAARGAPLRGGEFTSLSPLPQLAPAAGACRRLSHDWLPRRERAGDAGAGGLFRGECALQGLSAHDFPPAGIYTPPPLARLVRTASICPLRLPDWSLLRVYSPAGELGVPLFVARRRTLPLALLAPGIHPRPLTSTPEPLSSTTEPLLSAVREFCVSLVPACIPQTKYLERFCS